MAPWRQGALDDPELGLLTTTLTNNESLLTDTLDKQRQPYSYDMAVHRHALLGGAVSIYIYTYLGGAVYIYIYTCHPANACGAVRIIYVD